MIFVSWGSVRSGRFVSARPEAIDAGAPLGTPEGAEGGKRCNVVDRARD
jgi:hypothetical protein